MNCRLQDEVQSMCEGAEAWCAGNRKFWAAAVGQKQPLRSDLTHQALEERLTNYRNKWLHPSIRIFRYCNFFEILRPVH